MVKIFIPILLVFTGCSSTTSSSENGRHQIQCVNDMNACHERGRSICPDGYLVTNRIRPVKVDGGDTHYTLNIKCRDPITY